MKKKRLLVDMDGTLARFHDEANYLECMYEKGFFANLKPFENMLEAIRILTKEYADVEVLTCSAAVQSPYCCDDKNDWLDRYLPEVPLEQRLYTSIGKSKAAYLPGGVSKNDYLLDDYNRGLYQFMHSGGNAIKCHNNINQRGTGSYGGERGYMWDGPMIHASNSPSLIAAELAQLMGLHRSLDHLEQASKENNVNYVVAPQEGRQRFYDDHCDLHLIEVQDHGKSHCFIAAQRDKETDDVATSSFQNPYNALRYLSGDREAIEYRLHTGEGEDLYLSGYQLQAICQNVYGNMDYHQYLRADRSQLADDARLALNSRKNAIVGFVCELYEDGSERDLTPYYSHEAMLDHISTLAMEDKMYRAEWFVPFSEMAQEKHQDDMPKTASIEQLLQDAQERANNQVPSKNAQEGPGLIS